MSSDHQLRDAYRALELPASASLTQVRESYRVLSRVWHPDRFASNPEMLERATTKQQAINEAYKRLLAAYDAGLAPLADAEPDTSSRARTAPGAERRSDAHRDASMRSNAHDTGPGAATTVQPSNRSGGFPWSIVAAWRDRTEQLGRRRTAALIAATAAACIAAILAVWLTLATRTEVIRSADGSRVVASAISVGGGHACAATDSDVFCWGDNHEGQAGAGIARGSGDDPAVVRRARALNLGGPVRDVAAGLTHSCALHEDGVVRCWGGNHGAQLGDGTLDDRAEPAAVAAVAAFRQLSSLAQHTCATTVDGAIYCWGNDADGQLGIGAPVASCSLEQLQFHCSDRPARVAGTGWQAVSAGGSHTCAINSDRRVFCWGSNRHGQLGGRTEERCSGPGGTQPCRRQPGVVAGVGEVVAVAAGASHSCALDVAGRLTCWGMSTYGQIGPRTDTAPGALESSLSFRSVSAGAYHTCAVGTDDSLWCWGRDGSGELRGVARDRCDTEPCSPRPVRLLKSGVAAVDAGFGRTCVARTDHQTVCWGRGELTLSGGSGSARATSGLRGLRRVHAEVRWRLGTFARWLERLGS